MVNFLMFELKKLFYLSHIKSGQKSLWALCKAIFALYKASLHACMHVIYAIFTAIFGQVRSAIGGHRVGWWVIPPPYAHLWPK